jgi:hypothetical protein
MFYLKKKYIYTGNKKKVKSRFKHVLHDIFKKYFNHSYNIMIETVLTIKKTVDNLFGVNPFFWAQFDHTTSSHSNLMNPWSW